ncbi:MAG TPA: undecaprenyl-phosphate glucose phosphotransferase [Chloroflexota bacterium]|nr:undecaprenyl-phosphate glucose phosphotransferase [Chloroflexota bacterium]
MDLTRLLPPDLEAGGHKLTTAARTSVVHWTLALLAADLLAVLGGTVIAYWLRFTIDIIPYGEFHPFENYYGYLSTMLIATPIVMATNGLYRPRRSISWVDHLYLIFAGVSVATALAIVTSAIMWHDVSSSRLLVGLAWALTIGFVVVERAALHHVQVALRSRGIGTERLLIVGTGESANLVLDRVRHSPGMGYRPVGFLSEAADLSFAHGLPVLGTLDDIGHVVRGHQIHTVVIATPTLSSRRLLELITQCASDRVNIKVVPDLFQYMTSGVNTTDLNGLPLISVKDVALRGWNLVLKRAMDLVVSSVVLVLLAPVMLFIALLVKLSSPGPVFLIQERVGLDGKPFPIIKFRTMRVDAERETGAVWARPDDPRRTRVGAFLRKYSVDELPQLVNVLVGDMSLVGPRPERPYFVAQFRQTIPRYFDRHNEKAGLTGWAQVNGLRGSTSIEDRTAYDLWYVENWSFWLDIKICLKTLFVVLKDPNAY